MSLPQGEKTAPPRVERLRRSLAAQNVDVFIAFKPEVTFYLTAFTPIIYSNPVIVIMTLDRDPILLVNALRDELAHASPWVSDVRLYGNWYGRQSVAPTWDAALEVILAELGVSNKTVGIEANFISLDLDKRLRNVLPNATFADVSPSVNQCRLIKDEDEVANARIAAKIADAGMRAIVARLAEGGTERDASVAGMCKMNAFWVENYPDVKVCAFGSLEAGQQNGLEAWVLSGPRKWLGCDSPAARKPEAGETISAFVWAVANGMRAELDRTICVGTVAESEREAIAAIHTIRKEVEELMKPGTPANALYDVARRGLEANGYGGYLPGRIGHAIGLGNHEDFSINANTSLALRPGMIVTLEPHISIRGVCSTQFSDTVLITEDGHEYLTTPPWDWDLEVNPPKGYLSGIGSWFGIGSSRLRIGNEMKVSECT